jgi:hypothetical protein
MGVKENEAILRRFVAAWNVNDWDAMDAICAPDVAATPLEGWPEQESAVGKIGVRRAFERLKEPWAEEQLQILTVDSRQEWALLHLRWLGRGQGSGLDLDLEFWGAYELRGGLIVRMAFSREEGEARRVSGIGAEGLGS